LRKKKKKKTQIPSSSKSDLTVVARLHAATSKPICSYPRHGTEENSAVQCGHPPTSPTCYTLFELEWRSIQTFVANIERITKSTLNVLERKFQSQVTIGPHRFLHLSSVPTFGCTTVPFFDRIDIYSYTYTTLSFFFFFDLIRFMFSLSLHKFQPSTSVIK
jgi:hypothetical protein